MGVVLNSHGAFLERYADTFVRKMRRYGSREAATFITHNVDEEYWKELSVIVLRKLREHGIKLTDLDFENYT